MGGQGFINDIKPLFGFFQFLVLLFVFLWNIFIELINGAYHSLIERETLIPSSWTFSSSFTKLNLSITYFSIASLSSESFWIKLSSI